MSFKVIESKDNKTYKELLALKKGDSKNGLFLAEGKDMVDEAIRAGSLKALIVLDGTHAPMLDVPIYGLKQGLYRELSSYQSLPEMMAICERKMTTDLGDRVIYLDKIQDPGNAGTIIRTALSFGYTGVLFSPDSVSLYNSKTIQASKGSIFHIAIGRGELKDLKDKGYSIYLTVLNGEDERKFSSLGDKFVIAFGNEGQGISKKNIDLGTKFRIEMNGIDSLNVGVAAGIFMYRFKK